MTDWEKIKETYLNTQTSYKKLADSFGVAYTTVKSRARREGWAQQREKRQAGDPESTMERVTAKLLNRMEKAIDRSTEMDSKEIKAITGALKELRELQKQGEGAQESGGKKLEVCFIGETEELSR